MVISIAMLNYQRVTLYQRSRWIFLLRRGREPRWTNPVWPRLAMVGELPLPLFVLLRLPQRLKDVDVAQNGRPRGPQMLVYFSIHHPIIGVPNFDPYPCGLLSNWQSGNDELLRQVVEKTEQRSHWFFWFRQNAKSILYNSSKEDIRVWQNELIVKALRFESLKNYCRYWFIYVYSCLHLFMYIYMYVCMYACMHACMFMYIYICLFMFVYIPVMKVYAVSI